MVWSNGRWRSGRCRRRPTVGSRPRQPISTYITAVVAGPYHYVTDRTHVLRTDELEIPLGAMCRKGRWPRTSTPTTIFLVTKQGLDFFHDHFDYPYPFGKYDQAFVPEYNLGAMENPGWSPSARSTSSAAKVTRGVVRGRGRTSSCTRWRTCGSATWSPWSGGTTCGSRSPSPTSWAPSSLRRGDPLHRRLDHLRQPPQGLGLPRRPAARPPTRHRRHPRPGGRQAQLRRHHVRQGRLRAQAARRLRRPGRVPGGRAALLQAARVRQHALAICCRCCRRRRPGHGRLGAGVAADGGGLDAVARRRRGLPDRSAVPSTGIGPLRLRRLRRVGGGRPSGAGPGGGAYPGAGARRAARDAQRRSCCGRRCRRRRTRRWRTWTRS